MSVDKYLQQLNQQFEQNEELEPAQVLADRGLQDVFDQRRLQGSVGQLLNQAFLEDRHISEQDLGKYNALR